MIRNKILNVWLDPPDLKRLGTDELTFDVSDMDTIKIESAPSAILEGGELAVTDWESDDD